MSVGLSKLRRKIRQFTLSVAPLCPFPGLRAKLLRHGGIVLGEDSYVNMLVAMVVDIDAGITVSIGKRVAVAPGVVFAAVSGGNQSKVEEYYPTKKKTIYVEDDVWIGANATILPGIRLGRMSIVGAGAVVSKDVEPGSIVAGVPARVIRRLTDVMTTDVPEESKEGGVANLESRAPGR